MGTIILTSTGLSSPQVREAFVEITKNLIDRSVAIVTTAAEGKEKNKYSILAREQFQQLSYSLVDYVDLEVAPDADLTIYSVIYVCGGNTFKLLRCARQANFGSSVESLLVRGGIYVGVSAGSIIMSPDISIAGEVCGDTNDAGLSDLTGLGLISFDTAVHFDLSESDVVRKYEERHKRQVRTITNDQALVLTGDNIQEIGY